MGLTSQEIQAILPHRWPFLLVDTIEELQPGSRAIGIKNVTINEPFFQGHFPGHPIMPGVLIVEALAQVGSVALLSLEQNKGKVGYFAGIDSFRFRKPVLPGDILRLEVSLSRMRGPVGKGTARAQVSGSTIAEGELTFAVVDLKDDESG
jgi:3-hydroxyacyl-[acyl-carrier-protein] dehydratase